MWSLVSTALRAGAVDGANGAALPRSNPPFPPTRIKKHGVCHTGREGERERQRKAWVGDRDVESQRTREVADTTAVISSLLSRHRGFCQTQVATQLPLRKCSDARLNITELTVLFFFKNTP